MESILWRMAGDVSKLPCRKALSLEWLCLSGGGDVDFDQQQLREVGLLVPKFGGATPRGVEERDEIPA